MLPRLRCPRHGKAAVAEEQGVGGRQLRMENDKKEKMKKNDDISRRSGR